MDDLQALDAQLCFPLYAASRAVTRRYATLLEGTGLTYPQYLTLMALWDAGSPLTVTALGERLRLDSGTLTPLLKRLEGAGWVTRRRDDADERRVLVALTDAGAGLRAELRRVPVQLATDFGLDEREVLAIRSLLDKLLVGVDAAGVDATSAHDDAAAGG